MEDKIRKRRQEKEEPYSNARRNKHEQISGHAYKYVRAVYLQGTYWNEASHIGKHSIFCNVKETSLMSKDSILMSALTHLFEIRIDDPSLFLSEIGDSSTGCSPGLFWTDTVLEKIRIFRSPSRLFAWELNRELAPKERIVVTVMLSPNGLSTGSKVWLRSPEYRRHFTRSLSINSFPHSKNIYRSENIFLWKGKDSNPVPCILFLLFPLRNPVKCNHRCSRSI